MSERQEAATPDLSRLVVDYVWRFNLAARRAERVRRSDGFVVERRVMTREEVDREMLKAGTKPITTRDIGVRADISEKPKLENPGEEKTMRSDTRERGEALVGQKHNYVTITEFLGPHLKPPHALMVDAKCDCGAMMHSVVASHITGGKRPCCNKRTCPVFRGASNGATAPASKPTRRTEKLHRTARVAKTRRASSRVRVPQVQPPPSVTNGNGDWRKVLSGEAESLRRAAVGILAGRTTVEDLARALREQADKLDEVIYAEA